MKTVRAVRVLTTFTAPTVFAILTAAPADAQVSLRLSAGARSSSALVRDFIVVPVDLRPGLGVTLGVEASTPLDRGWTLDATLDFTAATLHRRESGSTQSLGSLQTAALTLGLSHRLWNSVSGRFGIGGMTYHSRDTGVFRRGGPGLAALGTAGIRYQPGFFGARAVALEARYDLHRFVTPALRDVGFSTPQPVHRVALFVSTQILGSAR